MGSTAFRIRVAEFLRIDGDVKLLSGNNELAVKNPPKCGSWSTADERRNKDTPFF